MPNRLLKESICTSENIDQLSAFAETVFYRLIVNVDDYGRIDARPKLLASKLFPLKDVRLTQIEDALRALTSAELVNTYTVDGKPFLQMNTWDKHQTIRAKKSKYPSPADADNLQTSASKCMQMHADASKCSRNPIQSNPIQSESESNPSITRAREYEHDDGFDSFWKAYPKKSGDIRQTYMEYIHALDLGALPDILIESIKEQTQNVKAEDFRYIPSAEKWLRNRGWEMRMPANQKTGNIFMQMLEDGNG